MNKKIILILAFLLILSTTIGVVAYASTNISLIKPDEPDTIVITFPMPTSVVVYPSGEVKPFATPEPTEIVPV